MSKALLAYNFAALMLPIPLGRHVSTETGNNRKKTKMDYLFFAAAWVLWCSLHSLLIAPPINNFFSRRFKNNHNHVRLFYNLLALVTLVPVVWFGSGLRGPLVIFWQGPYLIVQLFLIMAGIGLFAAGARRYDLRHFMGLARTDAPISHRSASREEAFKTGGILNVTRHPWYLGGLMLIWARNLDLATLISNIIVSLYLFIGIFLEERKLIACHGNRYRRYQKQVSMLIPFKWIKARFDRRHNSPHG